MATVLLIDMDGVLADFDAGFFAAWQSHYPNAPMVNQKDRKSPKVIEEFDSQFSPQIKAIFEAEGFFRNLPLVHNANNILQRLADENFDVWVCSSPLRNYEHCVQEKFTWIETHFGRYWTSRIILTKDKSMIQGDLLIDDQPPHQPHHPPLWTHILFNTPGNRSIRHNHPLNLDWSTWHDVLRPWLPDRIQRCTLIRNRDLLLQGNRGSPLDSFCIVCAPPQIDPHEHIITIDVLPDEPAAILDSVPERNPDQPTVSSVAITNGDNWILSGGVVLCDNEYRLAVGLRPGDHTHPFRFTNITAGYCNQRLSAHCARELATKCVLFVSNSGVWRRVDFAGTDADCTRLRNPLAHWLAVHNGCESTTVQRMPFNSISVEKDSLWTLNVRYGGLVEDEVLQGFLAKGDGRVVDFRLPRRVDLSGFDDTEFLSREGTCYSEWWTIEQLCNALLLGEHSTNRSLEPFLRSLVTPENLWLIAVPMGELGRALISYQKAVESEVRCNDASQYPPHCTLVRHFKCEGSAIESVIRAFNKLKDAARDESTTLVNVQTPQFRDAHHRPLDLSIQIGENNQHGEIKYHCLPLESEWLQRIAADFNEACVHLSGVGFMRIKVPPPAARARPASPNALRTLSEFKQRATEEPNLPNSPVITLASHFRTNDELPLRQIALRTFQSPSVERKWQLRLIRSLQGRSESLSAWST